MPFSFIQLLMIKITELRAPSEGSYLTIVIGGALVQTG